MVEVEGWAHRDTWVFLEWVRASMGADAKIVAELFAVPLAAWQQWVVVRSFALETTAVSIQQQVLERLMHC